MDEGSLCYKLYCPESDTTVMIGDVTFIEKHEENLLITDYDSSHELQKAPGTNSVPVIGNISPRKI